jgi:hypothetical protein
MTLPPKGMDDSHQSIGIIEENSIRIIFLPQLLEAFPVAFGI